MDILIVEDNTGDVVLIKETLSLARERPQLHVVQNGIEALQFLRQENPYSNARRPDLILLDLNLPKKDGRTVLGEIKGDAGLKTIPVIIFTSSRAPQDKNDCYRLHANCYIAKPGDLDGFIGAIQFIHQYWTEITDLPCKDHLV